jgi:hypothetical protein
MIADFVLRDLSASQQRQVAEAVTRISLSWTLDAVSQMTVELHDPGMKMFLANYFQVRREVVYKNVVFEIAVTEIKQSSGSGASIVLECRRKPIQQLKRNKKPDAIGGLTATDYANLAASSVGLKFVGEPTSVQRSIFQVQNARADESVFSVLQTLANEAQFSLFESDGTLYFASQEWLLDKWANIPLRFPSAVNPQSNNAFVQSTAQALSAAAVGTIVPTSESRTNDGRTVPVPVVKGNIDLSKRKAVRLPSGEIATIRSLGFEDDGLEVVIPTIGPRGEDWTDDQALNHYYRTGQHLGKLQTSQEATIYSIWLSESEARRIAAPSVVSSATANVAPAINPDAFQILEIPNCRRSDDSETEAEVRFVLRRNASTMALRAGMTVNVTGLGEFSRRYLISEVSYEEGQPDPVALSCRTPVKKIPTDEFGNKLKTST